MTIKQFTKDLSPIGVMGLSKAKSTDSKQLSARCTGVRVLNYLENEWSSPVKDRLSPKLTKNQFHRNIQEMTKEAEQKAILAETYYREGKMGVNKIVEEVGVFKMTLHKHLRHRKVEISGYNKTIKLV